MLRQDGATADRSGFCLPVERLRARGCYRRSGGIPYEMSVQEPAHPVSALLRQPADLGRAAQADRRRIGAARRDVHPSSAPDASMDDHAMDGVLQRSRRSYAGCHAGRRQGRAESRHSARSAGGFGHGGRSRYLIISGSWPAALWRPSGCWRRTGIHPKPSCSVGTQHNLRPSPHAR
jgi:hypothetical protein